MNTNIKPLRVFIVSIVLILPINAIIHAQDRLLLSDNDMEEYKLMSQMNTFWPISADSLKSNVIRQRWRISGKDDFYINYCEFDCEENAIKGTAYAANSNAMPFIFGSPTGEIIGNASWVALDGGAVYFQKGNIGIKIFKPVNLKPEDRNNILNISNKVLVKIRDNIPSDIKTKEKELLKYQISITDYQKTTEESKVLLIQDGYTEYKAENSKWLVTEDSLVMGFRKQWSKDQSIFSIDIAQYSNVIDAQKAIEYQGKIFVSPVCIINDNNSVYEAINECLNKWDISDTIKYISIVGRSGNISIHLFYYNNTGIDAEKMYKLINVINK